FRYMTAPQPTPPIATSVTTPTETWTNPSDVCVANTQGEGVYLRSLPMGNFKTGSAYPEGTKFSVDDERECRPGNRTADSFCAVEAPDGSKGYLPSRYASVCR
ncbi:MAG: hypothetical protein AB7K71_27940, partial [Polyangiaceae bacterium]